MEATLQGSYASLRYTHQPNPEPPPPGSRRPVTRFTAKSRARFVRYLARLRRDLYGVWLTLTFPDPEPSPREAKRRLHAFLVALLKRYPTLVVFWKLEFGEHTGRIHFHLIIVADPLPWLDYDYIRSLWPGHVWIEFIRKNTLTTYVSKYTFKPSLAPGAEAPADATECEAGASAVLLDLDAKSETSFPGRFWGIRNRERYYSLLAPLRRVDPRLLLNHPYFRAALDAARARLGFTPPAFSAVLFYPPFLEA